MLLLRFLSSLIMYLIGYSSGLVLDFDIFPFTSRRSYIKWVLLLNFFLWNFSRCLFLIFFFLSAAFLGERSPLSHSISGFNLLPQLCPCSECCARPLSLPDLYAFTKCFLLASQDCSVSGEDFFGGSRKSLSLCLRHQCETQ